MPKRENDLIRETRLLIESTVVLRASLLDYQRACERLMKIGQPRQPASDTVGMLERLKFGEKRGRVASALEEFESARQKVRVELLTAAREDGRNLSDVARAFGVSRQLTSRLAAKAKGRDR